MAETEGPERPDDAEQVYSVEQDWAAIQLALKSFRRITGSYKYGGLSAAYKQSIAALDAFQRLKAMT